jgi:hypothetical protein
MNGLNWFAILLAGAVGAVIAVVLEFLLSGRREAAHVAISHRNMLLAYHAEIAANVRRIQRSELLPAAIIPFEEPVAEHLAAGVIFYAVPDYEIVTSFNEAVRARRYLEESWLGIVAAPKFQEWERRVQERFLRRSLLVRLPTWAHIARWIEGQYSIPPEHRIDFTKLEELVRSYDGELEEGLKETGSMLLAEQWTFIRRSVGLD